MLGLTSKIYYSVMLMWILWLRNLFHNLMTNYAWNNYVLPKTIKLRKLVTRATDLETRMQGQQWLYSGTFACTIQCSKMVVVVEKLSAKEVHNNQACSRGYLREWGAVLSLFRRGEAFRRWRWWLWWWSRPKTTLHVANDGLGGWWRVELSAKLRPTTFF